MVYMLIKKGSVSMALWKPTPFLMDKTLFYQLILVSKNERIVK